MYEIIWKLCLYPPAVNLSFDTVDDIDFMVGKIAVGNSSVNDIDDGDSNGGRYFVGFFDSGWSGGNILILRAIAWIVLDEDAPFCCSIQ